MSSARRPTVVVAGVSVTHAPGDDVPTITPLDNQGPVSVRPSRLFCSRFVAMEVRQELENLEATLRLARRR